MLEFQSQVKNPFDIRSQNWYHTRVPRNRICYKGDVCARIELTKPRAYRILIIAGGTQRRYECLKSRTAIKLVREWIDLHVAELREDWKLAQAGREIKKIEPLD